MLRRSIKVSIHLLVILVAAAAAGRAAEPLVETEPDRHVNRPDSSYRWKLLGTTKRDGLATYVVDMTSQTWRTKAGWTEPSGNTGW